MAPKPPSINQPKIEIQIQNIEFTKETINGFLYENINYSDIQFQIVPTDHKEVISNTITYDTTKVIGGITNLKNNYKTLRIEYDEWSYGPYGGSLSLDIEVSKLATTAQHFFINTHSTEVWVDQGSTRTNQIKNIRYVKVSLDGANIKVELYQELSNTWDNTSPIVYDNGERVAPLTITSASFGTQLTFQKITLLPKA